MSEQTMAVGPIWFSDSALARDDHENAFIHLRQRRTL